MVSLLRGKQFYYDDTAAVSQEPQKPMMPNGHARSASAGDSPVVAEDSRAVAGRDGAARRHGRGA
jgi:hypothetical protein